MLGPNASGGASSDDDPNAAGGASSDDAPGAAGQAGMAEPPPAMDEPPPTPSAGPVTLYLAGDSIVQTYTDTPSDRDQAGWGQMLGAFVSTDVRIDNRAIGGRTARRFIDEGRLEDLAADLLPGDYLLVQFGTNDGNRTATYQLGEEIVPYFLEPATDFKTWLGRYAEAARARGAIPVFVTPPPRNSAYCTGGNGTGAHAQAMRELGQALTVGVVDLNADSVAYLRAIYPAPTPEDFFLLRTDGSVDGTHFQENGARILAGFVARGLPAAAPDLAGVISDDALR
jgi:lysophospholipase L1-like esterase